MDAGKPLARLRRSVLALPLAALAALVVVAINETGYNTASESLATLDEHIGARIQTQLLVRGLLDAESGQRGYLLTQREGYLRPYRAGVESVGRSMEFLRKFYSADPHSRVIVEQMDEKVQQKLSELATTLEYYQQGKHEQWQQLLLSNIGKEKLDEVRSAANALYELESERITVQRHAIIDTLFISRIGVNTMAAMALLALVLFLRQTRAIDQLQRQHAQELKSERDQLEAEVARRTADLTELAQHLQSAREDERSRIARELHDELGALLTAAKLDAARLKRSLGDILPDGQERLKNLTTTLDHGIALKRRIIEDLRPSSLSNLGLEAALQIQAKEWSQRAEVRVRTELAPVTLSDSAQITVYRLVQESLTNIAKYAKANAVTVSLGPDDGQAGRVRVAVHDDGAGFDPGTTRRSAHGLMGMRYRVEAEGGSMRVRSAPGRGTTIEAWLPAG